MNTEKHDLGNLIIVTAKGESFQRVFLGEQRWYPIRLVAKRVQSLAWIAVYKTAPFYAITHFAKIIKIEIYEDSGRYAILFDKPKEISIPITLGNESRTSMQGQRYTSIEKLLSAKTVSELKPWDTGLRIL